MARTPSVISGVVRGPDGKTVSNARVYFTAGPVPLPEIAALTDDSGEFTLTAPAPGEYVIESAADEFGARSTKVKVKGGEQVRLDLKLKN
jgi:Carboxypeptidase regulatory-like domain